MKKIGTVLLVLAMLLCVVGCKESDSDSNIVSFTSQTEETSSNETSVTTVETIATTTSKPTIKNTTTKRSTTTTNETSISTVETIATTTNKPTTKNTTKQNTSTTSTEKTTTMQNITTTTTKPKPQNVVATPLMAFLGVDGDIIVEATDELPFFNPEFFFVKNAYHYENGQLVKLEAYETEIKFNADSYYMDRGDVTIPIKYFICNDTVYPYVNVHPTQHKNGRYIFSSIPGDPENILIHSGVRFDISPLVYNVISGEHRPLFTETDASYLCVIDENGKYVAVRGGSDKELSMLNAGEIYVLNLKDGTSQKLPTISYDEKKFTKCTVSPEMFIDDEVIVNYRISNDPYIDNDYYETYYVNLKNGQMRKWDKAITFPEYMDGLPKEYLLTEEDEENGSLTVYNLRTNQQYSYQGEPGTEFIGNYNASGKLFLSGYESQEIDANGNFVAEINRQPFLLNMEKGEKVDISKCVKDFTITKYKGNIVTSKQWIDETHLLITYVKDGACYTDILDLKGALKLS